jgi:ribosomal protein S18 acetylase RimI-like enzyme
MIALRLATVDDVAVVFPRTRALNAHEDIEIDEARHRAALEQLLADPSLGAVWLIERAGAVIGYAIVTFGYDLEFAGRDAWLTELWIDEAARGNGAAQQALALLEPELRARGVHAMHLQVRPENPAARMYARAGFVTVPRQIMTRRLRPIP